MLVIKLLILIMLWSPVFSAYANDFRALNFGEPCQELDQYEMNEGSILGTDFTGYQYNFENVLFDRQVLITYLCDAENKFIRGVLRYGFESTQSAKEYFATISPQLSYIYGDPLIIDNEEEHIGMRAFWKNQASSIHLRVIESHSNDGKTYVGINFVPAPD
jgi:hypothetical protein